jgi:hypothetical protein
MNPRQKIFLTALSFTFCSQSINASEACNDSLKSGKQVSTFVTEIIEERITRTHSLRNSYTETIRPLNMPGMLKASLEGDLPTLREYLINETPQKITTALTNYMEKEAAISDWFISQVNQNITDNDLKKKLIQYTKDVSLYPYAYLELSTNSQIIKLINLYSESNRGWKMIDGKLGFKNEETRDKHREIRSKLESIRKNQLAITDLITRTDGNRPCDEN